MRYRCVWQAECVFFAMAKVAFDNQNKCFAFKYIAFESEYVAFDNQDTFQLTIRIRMRQNALRLTIRMHMRLTTRMCIW